MTEKEKAVLNSVIEDLMVKASEAELKRLQDSIKISTLECTVNQLNIDRNKQRELSEEHRKLNGKLREENIRLREELRRIRDGNPLEQTGTE